MDLLDQSAALSDLQSELHKAGLDAELIAATTVPQLIVWHPDVIRTVTVTAVQEEGEELIYLARSGQSGSRATEPYQVVGFAAAVLDIELL